MHMAHFHHAQHLGRKSTPIQPKISGLRSSRNHRTFFNGQRNGIQFPVDQKIGSHPKGHIIIANRVLYKLIMEFLNLRLIVPVSRQHLHRRSRISSVMIHQPFNLGLFGEFTKTFYRLFHAFSFNVKYVCASAKPFTWASTN